MLNTQLSNSYFPSKPNMSPKTPAQNEASTDMNTITSLLRNVTIPNLLATTDEEKLRKAAWEILQKLPPEIKKNPEIATAIVRTVLGGGGVADVVLWLARKVAERVLEDGSREIVVLGGGEGEGNEVKVGGRNPLKIRAKL
jgi:hypothetical protein